MSKTFTPDEILANRRRWLDDLKDPANQGKQGAGQLECEGKFCCLGRAAFLFVDPENRTEEEDDSRFVNYEGTTDVAPPTVMSALDLRDKAGAFSVLDLENPEPWSEDGEFLREAGLVGMNDDDGMTFQQIAEFIEANPKSIFKPVDGDRYL